MIEHNETISRVLFNPDHIRADGGVRTGLFSPTDIRKKGVSLIRPEHLSPEELKAHAVAIAEKYHKPRTAEGVIECVAEEIREIVADDDGLRLLCLYDDPVSGSDALPDNPAHATAIASREVRDEDIPEIKTKLTKAFGPLRRFEE